VLNPPLKKDKEVVPPEIKARLLLCEILPPNARKEFLEKDCFHHQGRVGLYKICRNSRTEVYRNGRLAASGCLQLTIFAPTYDRMAAEYLILKNDERLYWTKANVFPIRRSFDLRLLPIIFFDSALLLNLICNYWL
jgi:hypothetical protein